MPIEFFCEHCQSKLRTPDETAGKRVRCPQCGNISSIPLESSSSTTTPEPKKDSVFGNQPTTNQPAANPYSSPVVDSRPAQFASGFPSYSNRESIKSRLLGPGIALIVANAITLLGGLFILFGAFMGLGNGRQPIEEAIVPFAVSFYVIVLSSVSVAGGIGMVSFKNPRLAFVGSITSILNGVCCCVLPIPFGIWALVVLMDHDVRNHYT